MNDVLMGILRVRDLSSPPYIDTQPFTMAHRVSEKDQFVVMGSDGLFDFFSNDEDVHLVHFFMQRNPSGDPAKHLIEQLVQRAADHAASWPYSWLLEGKCLVLRVDGADMKISSCYKIDVLDHFGVTKIC